MSDKPGKGMFERLRGAAKARFQSTNKGGWSPIVPVPEKAPAAPILRIRGIEFERRKGGASSSRTIYLERVPKKKV